MAIPPHGHGEKEWHVTTETIQLLTPEGERVDHPEYPLDDADIKGMYRDMVLVRRIDTEAIALQRQGELGLWASLLGQEAAQIGSARALSPKDMAFPSYREHGVAWCRGLDPLRLIEMFRGVTNGAWDPEEHKFHLYTIVIGDQTLHATGYAMGIQRDGSEDEAVIAYFGDGATSQGDVSEAFAWASVFNAPLVFFCQNNQFAISAPPERQSRAPIYQRASGFGFPGILVDGNDVLACYAVTRQALRAAREGEGPTLIEAFTYRMGAHTTTDDPTRYRLASELEAWRLRDPIERVRSYLARTGEADGAFFEQVAAEADELAAKLRAALPRAARSAAARAVRPRVRGAERDPRRRARPVRGLPGGIRGEGSRAMTRITLSRALNEGLRRALEADQKVMIMGEDVGRLGGVFRVTDGLQKDFGEHRVVDTPLAESGDRRHRDRPGAARLPAGLRDPVRRLRLPGDRPDRQPARQDAVPVARPRRAARRDPHPVRRRHRRGRAPQRVARGLLRAHRGAPRGRLRRPRGRVRHDPARDRRATTR